MRRGEIRNVLEKYGDIGVQALAEATPKETGLASESWTYKVKHRHGTWSIVFSNSDVENGFPVVIMLQYGHGTGNGGYVQGIDFINPALKPVFDSIAEEAWMEVTR
jgi:hypothetical protein